VHASRSHPPADIHVSLETWAHTKRTTWRGEYSTSPAGTFLTEHPFGHSGTNHRSQCRCLSDAQRGFHTHAGPAMAGPHVRAWGRLTTPRRWATSHTRVGTFLTGPQAGTRGRLTAPCTSACPPSGVGHRTHLGTFPNRTPFRSLGDISLLPKRARPPRREGYQLVVPTAVPHRYYSARGTGPSLGGLQTMITLRHALGGDHTCTSAMTGVWAWPRVISRGPAPQRPALRGMPRRRALTRAGVKGPSANKPSPTPYEK
jgi:hypothetical protein